MKRLYYLTDEIDQAEQIAELLGENGIDLQHIHVLSKNEAEVEMHHLHGPDFLQRVDFLRGALNGVMGGALIAAVVLTLAQFIWQAGIEPLGQFALFLLMMLFGTWLGGLIGFANENIHLRRFHQQVENGRHLLMIDVAPDQERLVHRILDFLDVAQYGGEDRHVLI